VLPDGVEIPSGFEHAGHIAHLNLKETNLPFKDIIGQVVLDVRVFL
jgi:tRNA (guanine37-N1)-methyltransferase